jgi:hypothetical protein
MAVQQGQRLGLEGDQKVVSQGRKEVYKLRMFKKPSC